MEKIIKFFRSIFAKKKDECQHLSTKLIWKDYQEGYIETECCDCKKRFFSDI